MMILIRSQYIISRLSMLICIHSQDMEIKQKNVQWTPRQLQLAVETAISVVANAAVTEANRRVVVEYTI
jgi:hypothetical protein